jgi:hypothetical protein
MTLQRSRRNFSSEIRDGCMADVSRCAGFGDLSWLRGIVVTFASS